jgi:regulator of sirC expression with transglutaminase-like and TPR domain
MADKTRAALEEILRGREDALTLDRAAAEIARIEFPALQDAEVVAQLDRLAEAVQKRMQYGFRLAAERHLFEALGYAGNEEDYYNPHNSCLNWVLSSKRGIPITLCVMYMEVARRLNVAVDGIGAPGHFLVRLEEDGDTFYLDPFRGGIIREEVEEEVDARYLAPARKRSIIIRMLNNLRQIYLERRAWAKAEAVLDLVLTADPKDGDALRQRSAARAARQRFKAAAQDLERYLALFPDVEDAEELKKQLSRLQRMHAAQN